MGNIQLSLFGRMYPVLFHQPTEKILEPCLKKSQKPVFQCLQVANGQPQEWLEGRQLTQLGECLTLNFGEYPSVEKESTLSEILEDNAPEKYSLSLKACLGILRRAKNKNRKLPDNLRIALEQKIAEQGGEVIGLDFAHADSVVRTFTDKTPTLVQNMGRGGGQTPCVMYEKQTAAGFLDRNGEKAYSIGYETEKAPTIRASVTPSVFIEKKSVIPLRDEVTRNKASNGLGVGKVGGPCPTLTTADVHSVFYEAYQHNGYRESEVSGTLTTDQNSTIRGDTPLVVQGKKGKIIEKQCYQKTVGTLCARDYKGVGNEYVQENKLIVEKVIQKAERQGKQPTGVKDILKRAIQKVTYIIRRLTPIECERLQGYPDNWTKYGADGTEIADTARYRAIGNSICVYCAERVYRGILDVLEDDKGNAIQ